MDESRDDSKEEKKTRASKKKDDAKEEKEESDDNKEEKEGKKKDDGKKKKEGKKKKAKKAKKKSKPKAKQTKETAGGGGGGGGGGGEGKFDVETEDEGDETEDEGDDADDDDGSQPTVIPVSETTTIFPGSCPITSLNLTNIGRFVEVYLRAITGLPRSIHEAESPPLSYDALSAEYQKLVRDRCYCQWHERHNHKKDELCNWCAGEADADTRCIICHRQFCAACLTRATGPESHPYTQVRDSFVSQRCWFVLVHGVGLEGVDVGELLE